MEGTKERLHRNSLSEPLVRIIRRHLHRMISMGELPTYEDFVIKNREFHVVLGEASGNGRLAAMLRNLLEEMQRLFLFGLDIRDSAKSRSRSIGSWWTPC